MSLFLIEMVNLYLHILKCFSFMILIIELAKGRAITGYDIMVAIRKFGFKASPGTVYNQIELLESEGLIESKSVKRVRSTKTVYKITEKGIRFYEEFKDKWREAFVYMSENIVA